MACVNISSVEFKKLTSEYNISSEDMELAVKSYMDKYNVDSYNPESVQFQDYIDTYFKIKSTNIYTSKTEFDAASNIWKYLSNISTSSLEEAQRLYNEASKMFDASNIIMYKTSDNKFKVRIAEPLYNSNNPYFTEEELDVFNTEDDKIDRFSETLLNENNELTEEQKQFILNALPNLDTFIEDVYKSFTQEKHQNNPYYQLFSQIIDILKINNIPVSIVKDFNIDSIAQIRRTSFKEAIIEINPKMMFDYLTQFDRKYMNSKIAKVVLHELVHSITSDIVSFHPSWSKLKGFDEAQSKFNAEIDRLYNITVKAIGSEQWYGLTNKAEFIAEALSNKAFQKRLSELKYDKKQTIFERIVNSIRDLFYRLFNKQGIDISNSVFDDILRVSQEYLDYAKSGINKNINTYSWGDTINKFEQIFEKGDRQIVYTPIGKTQQTYTIRKSEDGQYHIINKDGKEVFKEDSKDRRRIFANLAVKEGRAVVVTYKDKQYVVNNKDQIISVTTGDLMKWDANNVVRKTILEEAYKKFNTVQTSTQVNNNVKSSEFKEELEQLSTEDKQLLKEELGIMETPETIEQETFEQSDIDKQRSGLYNNPLLSASERTFLANNVMYLTSFMVSQLKSSKEANEYYFGNKFSKIDLTQLSRNEIIDIVGISNIFDYIREHYYNPDNRTDIDFDVADKLQVAYDNWGALCKSAYCKLIFLEGVTVVKSRPEDILLEDLEQQFQENLDSDTLAEKEREYWQIGIRNLSAKASLSGDIKREFEKLFVTDKNGNPIKDEFGFGFDTFVDSGIAVNSILEWVNSATTIVEMEDILKEYSTSYPWVNSILNKIKEEPFRSQFFQNFRKDFTQYSIVTVSRDKKTGLPVYTTSVINTKGATQAILDEVVSFYNMGLMKDIIITADGIEGKGRVNIQRVTELDVIIKNTITNIHKSVLQGNRTIYNKTLRDSLPVITDILKTFGVRVDENIVKAVINQPIPINTKDLRVIKLLTELSYITRTLLDNKDKTTYNPIEKGLFEGNIYQNYKNLINILGKYIQNSIESSTYENGKMHYSFVVPSYMGKLMLNLKNSIGDYNKFNQFMEENYASYRWFKDGDTWNNTWLELINSSEVYRNALEHKVQLSFNKDTYTELGEVSYLTSILQEYFYDTKGKKWAWYRVPILSNKPSSEFIKFKRYSGLTYQKDIKRGFSKVVNQELMRIRTVLDRAINPNVEKIGVKEKTSFDISDKLLRKYPELKNKLTSDKEGKLHLTYLDLVKEGKLITSDSGASFKFMDFLNDDIVNNTELGQLIIAKINGEIIDENKFSTLLNKRFDNAMEKIVSNEFSEYKRMGLFDMTEVKRGKQTNYAYKYIPNLSRDALTIAKEDLKLSDKELFKINNYMDKIENIMEAEAKQNLEEYVWNDMFATINIVQLTAVDLAYYRNIEDFQKRYAQVHSPSMRFNVYAEDSKGVRYSFDGKERTLYLKDSIEKSDIIPNVKQVFNSVIEQIANPDEKAEMTKMRDLILTSFEEINFADAQGYSSPTSYRKKQGMAGRWNDEMEEAYNRIKSGNFNVNDLGVVWQPMKPFVYSQIRKPSGSQIMTNLKVPVQNKNSEYLLILADAIMRGGNKVNKLSAIYDFMEDSAYDGRITEFDENTNTYKVLKEGTYNGKGIDTVQFISAVNSGALGAVDITRAQSYSEVKNILNSHTYINSDKLPTKENNNDRYNVQYVHTIPFEDYGIQQEIPAHFVDHEQLMGSQLRILSISDIRKGTLFKVGNDTDFITDEKLINEYQTLIAENIEDSFKDLIKEFKITGSRLERNKALERILQEAIEKDQKYGNDLQRACSLNEDGEFTIPLNDPIQSIRIQQLINSIIKSRINKQTVKGGPVVQASSFGMSDELSIIFKDKNGKLLDTFSEFCRKNNLDKSTKKAEDTYLSYLKDNQYSLSHFEVYTPIPSKELEEALTRYDEKGNAYIISMEEAVKEGIIPEEMRKGIGYRIPTEDKYSMAPIYIKGFLPRAAGDAIMLPKEITLLSGSDFDIDKMYVFLKSFIYDNTIDTKKFITGIMQTSKVTGETKKQRIDEVKMVIDQIHAGMQFSKGSEEDKVYQYYLKNKYKFDKGFKLATDKKSQRDNRIFDIQWAVLTNKDTAIKMFNPGSFDEQKKTSRIIRVLQEVDTKYTYEQLSKLSIDELDTILEKSTIKRNIVYPSTQIYFHKQNMTAGKMIGIFANNNTSHAFLSLQDIRLNLSEDNAFTFNGVKINKNENNKIDAQVGHNGKFISKTIAGFLAASVDAVKDPVLNFMNLNTFTSGPAMLLARLGFDSDSIGLLLSQPIIRELSNDYVKRNNDSYVSGNDLINEYLELYLKDKNTIKEYKKSLPKTQFNKEELALGISNKIIDTDFQKRVLVLFGNLLDISNELNTITFLTKFNSSTNATGPTIADTLVMEDRYERFLDNVDKGNTYFSKNVADVINNSPILRAFYEYEMSASTSLFKNYFPHYSLGFAKVLSTLRDCVTSNLDSKTINLLVNDYMLYYMTQGDNPVIDSSYNNRKNMILNFTTRFNRAKESLTDNELLKTIYIQSMPKGCKVPVLETKTGGYTQDIQERIRNSWTELLFKDKTRQFGKDLFLYSIFRNGFSYSPKGFLHMSSVDVKLAIDGYVEALNNINEELNIDDYNFILQFMRNHSSNKKLVPSVDNYSERIRENYSQLEGNTITITFREASDVNKIAISTIDGITTFSPVITYKDSLYYAKENKGIDSITYYKSSILGVQNNFLEYDANTPAFDIHSVINENLRDSSSDKEVIDTPSKENITFVDNSKKQVNNDKLTQEEINFILTNVLSEIEKQELNLTDSTSKRKILKEILEEQKSFTQDLSVQSKIDEILKKLC